MENVRNTRSWTFVLGLIMLGAVAIAIALAPSSARAEEQPFKIEFDKSEMQVGLLSQLPLDQVASTASIEGTIDENGNVKVPKDGFKLPTLGIEQPVKVSAFMGIEQDATGKYDAATGEMVLNTKAGIWLSVDVQALLQALGGFGVELPDGLDAITGLLGNDLTCGFAPMDVQFTTGKTSLGTGAPFAKGTLGPGALTGEWSKLGPFAGRTKALGFIDVCKLIKSQLPGLLEGALGESLPGGLDIGGLDLESLLANLDNLDLGPSSLTLTRSLDTSTPVTPGDPDSTPKSAKLRLTVNPKKKKVKAGKKTVFTVKVKNSGTGAAEGVNVCIKSPGKKVLKGKLCRSLGTVMAGATQTRRIGVKVRKGNKKKYKVGFEVRASNATRSNAATRILIRR